MKYVKYYRVQGGDGFSRSKNLLNVTDSNNLDVAARKKIHIGSEEHNKKFIKLRLAEKWKKYAKIDAKKANVNVVVMYFPDFFGKLLKQSAISEYISTGNDIEAPPHTVDINKGEAYALYGFWNLLMKSCNLYAKNIIVNNEKDIDDLYNDDEDFSKFNPINIQMLKNSLDHISKKAGITVQQIETILAEAKSINEEIMSYKKGNYER